MIYYYISSVSRSKMWSGHGRDGLSWFSGFWNLGWVDPAIPLAHSLPTASPLPALGLLTAWGPLGSWQGNSMAAQDSQRAKGRLPGPTKAGLDLTEQRFCLTLSPKAVTRWVQGKGKGTSTSL